MRHSTVLNGVGVTRIRSLDRPAASGVAMTRSVIAGLGGDRPARVQSRHQQPGGVPAPAGRAAHKRGDQQAEQQRQRVERIDDEQAAQSERDGR